MLSPSHLLPHFQHSRFSPRHPPPIFLPQLSLQILLLLRPLPILLLLRPPPIFLPLQPVTTFLHLQVSAAISSHHLQYRARENFSDAFFLASAALSSALRNLRNFFNSVRGQATSPFLGLLMSQFLQRMTTRCVTH